MKIVFSSTVEQDEEIHQLMMNLRVNVLPNYLSEKDRDIYEGMGILQFAQHGNWYNGTLREAYQLMTALQIVTDLITTVSNDKMKVEEKYYVIFDRNVKILNDFGLFFPFDLHFFHTDEQLKMPDKKIIQELIM